MIRVLLLDNHDSFTYNLAELLRRNSKIIFQILPEESIYIDQLSKYDKILISPGPGVPDEHPVMFEILKAWGDRKSIFGVCLGMQAIALHFGGELFNLDRVIHGRAKTIQVSVPGQRIFSGLPEQFEAGLYHSWAVRNDNFPGDLIVTAVSTDGVIMGIKHRKFDICGVQFHPESIMTPYGQRMIDNWIGN
jgi:anthranilate synthase component II